MSGPLKKNAVVPLPSYAAENEAQADFQRKPWRKNTMESVASHGSDANSLLGIDYLDVLEMSQRQSSSPIDARYFRAKSLNDSRVSSKHLPVTSIKDLFLEKESGASSPGSRSLRRKIFTEDFLSCGSPY